MVTRLPQGRGQRRGQDAYVGQREAEQTRKLFNVVGLFPKMCAPVNLTAEEIASPHLFVQTGPTAGLGLGPYLHAALCNGNNGTPDLRELFVRGAADGSGAGATGGADSSAHTHSVTSNVAVSDHSSHTHDIDHNHASVTSGAGSAHSHGSADTAVNGTLRARIDVNSTDDKIYADTSSTSGFTADRETTAGTLTVDNVSSARDLVTNIQGITDEESLHTHSVNLPALGTTASGGPSATLSHSVTNNAVTSGAASSTDNRPAFFAMPWLMRLN